MLYTLYNELAFRSYFEHFLRNYYQNVQDIELCETNNFFKMSKKVFIISKKFFVTSKWFRQLDITSNMLGSVLTLHQYRIMTYLIN